ncbi:MAG: ABC transporter ATP-binding protein [Phycisphaerae bacterium]|jgi:ABC-2 type transport system ATP-binding protein
MDICKFKQVTKLFGKTVALDKLDFTITSGSIIGLMGANGCGKSTLLRHIPGIYLPDSGTAELFGQDCAYLSDTTMARIGYVHQEGRLMEWMSVRQIIAYVRSYYDNWDSSLEADFIERFEIDLKARVGKLSPGKRQQLSILLAICHNPELLILDEPASALDPLARSRFLDLMLELIQSNEERTIIISSHILSDIEKVIDRAVIMDAGRILRDCPLDELRESYFRVIVQTDSPSAVSIAGAEVIRSRNDGTNTTLIVKDSSEQRIRATLAESGLRALVTPLSLEDIYKIVIGKTEYVS